MVWQWNWQTAIQLGFVLSFLLTLVSFFYIRYLRGKVVKLNQEVEGWMRDGLTGLWSRRRTMEIYQWLFKAVQAGYSCPDGQQRRDQDRVGKDLSIVMFDIDHFKKVNDEHGHLVGDVVLKTFGDILNEQIRLSDIAGRYGGEEFVVVLATNISGALAFAQRVRLAVKKKRFSANGGAKFSVTVSAGIAMLADVLCTPDELIERADQALYAAKGARDKCAVWGAEHILVH